MKTLLKIAFLLFLIIGCTKPKEETCVPVHLQVVSRQDWINGHWENTYVDTIVYLEQIGFFKDQSVINTYPHLDGARPGDIMYKDRNADGKINESDHCN